MISLDIRCIKDSDDICAYFNRYEYDVLFATDDNRDVVIGKGVVVLYLCGKALNDGFDIIMAFDENHHEGVYDVMFDNNKDEWRAQQHYEEMEQDTKKAFDSLNKCYKKDGYKRYKRTEYFYRLGE